MSWRDRLEQAVIRLTLERVQLEDMVVRLKEDASDGRPNIIDELESTVNELDALRVAHNELVCSHFPGDYELVIKLQDGSLRQPTVVHLRDLCRANGLVVLEKGHYICANCGGVRISDVECEWCVLKEKSDE